MNIEDFKYHNYPSSLVRRYGVYTLDDNKEGIDKYVFDLKKSYVHNYLDQRRYERIDLIFPRREFSLGGKENAKEENKNLPTITEPSVDNNQKKILKKVKIIPKEKALSPQPKQNVIASTVSQGFKIKSPLSPQCKKVKLHSLLKPIHRCNRNQPRAFAANFASPRYKDNYFNESSKLQQSLFNSPVNSTRKIKNKLGFTYNNVPFITRKNHQRKNSPFDLYQKRQLSMLKDKSLEEENERFITCLKDINEGKNNLPKIKDFMNLDVMRSSNIKFFNKYMGEKYNPHNYKIENL